MVVPPCSFLLITWYSLVCKYLKFYSFISLLMDSQVASGFCVTNNAAVSVFVYPPWGALGTRVGGSLAVELPLGLVRVRPRRTASSWLQKGCAVPNTPTWREWECPFSTPKQILSFTFLAVCWLSELLKQACHSPSGIPKALRIKSTLGSEFRAAELTSEALGLLSLSSALLRPRWG